MSGIPRGAADLAALGVRVRLGDFTAPASLADAFEGATQVLVVSSNETATAAVDQHIAAIDAARAAGARRILYTAHQAAAADSLFAPHARPRRHRAVPGRDEHPVHLAAQTGSTPATVPTPGRPGDGDR